MHPCLTQKTSLIRDFNPGCKERSRLMCAVIIFIIPPMSLPIKQNEPVNKMYLKNNR